MPAKLGEAIAVFYLATETPATAMPVLAAGTIPTTYEGVVPVDIGDWVIYDEGGISVWSEAEFKADFVEEASRNGL
mgnify:CR=1 FL=1